MNLTLKECWALIVALVLAAWFVGWLGGESSQINPNKEFYSLGYAECKAGMEHRYMQNKTEVTK